MIGGVTECVLTFVAIVDEDALRAVVRELVSRCRYATIVSDGGTGEVEVCGVGHWERKQTSKHASMQARKQTSKASKQASNVQATKQRASKQESNGGKGRGQGTGARDGGKGRGREQMLLIRVHHATDATDREEEEEEEEEEEVGSNMAHL